MPDENRNVQRRYQIAKTRFLEDSRSKPMGACLNRTRKFRHNIVELKLSSKKSSVNFVLDSQQSCLNLFWCSFSSHSIICSKRKKTRIVKIGSKKNSKIKHNKKGYFERKQPIDCCTELCRLLSLITTTEDLVNPSLAVTLIMPEPFHQ